MILNVLNFVKSLPYRRIHHHVYKMNQAYLRHLPASEKFELTFQYLDPAARIDRQFNFCRQISETVGTFAQRVATNIEKVVKKKNKNQDFVIQVTLSVDGNVVGNETTCGDVFVSSEKEVSLSVCQSVYKVIINSPWISGVALPTSMMAGFSIYPTKFDSVYTDRESSEFTWFKSENKINWELVGTGFVYNTSNDDIGKFLKLSCLPKNGAIEGPLIEAVSSVQVQAGPGLCPFESRHQFTREKCKGDTFRVVSYNILADLYCDSDFTREVLHPYCPPYALAIDYRKQLFVKELIGYNADIICLQEVDRKIYNYDLEPLFKQLDYGTDFCQKRGLVAEGVAVFFDKKRFKQLETFRLVLSDELNTNPLFSDYWERISKNENLSQRILDRSSVLQVNVLESLTNEEIVVLGNTHLYFHPDADHIRLIQGAVVIRYLENVLENTKKKFQHRVSLILTGDFNSVPSCGIFQLYTTSSVTEDHIDFQSKPEEAVKIPLNTSLRLKSACGTPKYTNFTAGFADCLDYIYCDAQNFEITQVVPFPSLDELAQHTALPSVVFPSDHIALISDLKWNGEVGTDRKCK